MMSVHSPVWAIAMMTDPAKGLGTCLLNTDNN